MYICINTYKSRHGKCGTCISYDSSKQMRQLDMVGQDLPLVLLQFLLCIAYTADYFFSCQQGKINSIHFVILTKREGCLNSRSFISVMRVQWYFCLYLI